MLEQADYTAQQTQAGPSRLTREVVPTSDDEDLFFLSQSSDRYGSSLGSASSSRQNGSSVRDDGNDDEDDHEAVLPTRHNPAPRRQSLATNHSREGSSQRDGLSVDPSLDAPTRASEAEPEMLPIPPSPSASPSRPHSPSLPPGSASKSIADTSGQPAHDAYDRSVQQRSIQAKAPLASEEVADLTVRPRSRSRSSSQHSDATISFPDSSVASRHHSPLSNPTLDPLTYASSTTSRDDPSSSRTRTSIDLVDDNASLHDARRHATAVDQDIQLARRLPSLSPDLSLPPLRIPGHGAAPPSPPPIPRQPPLVEPQGSSDPILEDERLARAAAAQPPTPPRRQLRTRKAAQLNPYTLEAMRYQRALIRNDWQDAVVSQREWHRQERKRLADEAARAQREAQGAQGSEESQSQWLIPSSGPSSQADHEEASAPSSPAGASMPQVFVDIPTLDEIGPIRPHVRGARPRQPSPSPSQSGRLPELAEMLAKTSNSTSLHPNRSRPDTSRHATYKGPRTIARGDASSQSGQAQSSESLQIDEDDALPLPAPTRRKPRLRALSPSEGEVAPDIVRPEPVNHDAFIVESSEDERPRTVAPVPKAKRRSRWSGDGSSSDSTDYERRFRQLKKMMPAGMARKHIRDLRAMRHGKAYHSDGHLSSSSSDAGANNATDRQGAARAQARPADTVQISDDEDLQPGQTRKRLRRHESLDGNNALLLDPDSDSSSSSAASASSLSSEPPAANPYADPYRRIDDKEAEEVDESPAPWWSVSRLDSYVPYRERDAIDRMLSRTGGRKPTSKSHIRRATGVSQHRQARLDGFVSTHRHQEHATGLLRSHLREIDQNQNRRRDQGTSIEVTDKDAQHRLSKRKKKRRKVDPRVGRTTTGSSAPRGPVVLRNPPVVRPRIRPRLDLEQHNVLFAANPTDARHGARNANVDDAPCDGDVSDDDGQWQVLSSVIRDSTPVPLPDLRLAVPRKRTAAGAPQIPSLSTMHDAMASPIRGLHASPSASSSSAALVRINAVNDHSPGTPTRPRPNLFPQNAQIRSSAVPKAVVTPIGGGDPGANDVWDDFEGISLDFGMVPFAGGARLNATDSSLLARLPDLILLSDRLLRHERVPRTWSGDVLRLEDTTLETEMDHGALDGRLPFFFDNLRLQVGRALSEGSDGSAPDARRQMRNLVADTGAFLGCWMVRQAQSAADGRTDFATVFRSYRTILERTEQLQASVLSLHDTTNVSKSSREDRKLTCLQLAWMRFELCWRAMAICDADASNALEPDAPTIEGLLSYARTLMALLLHHGLHRSIRNVRKATGTSSANDDATAMDVDQDGDNAVSIDETTVMWLGVIHLLGSFEQSRGISDGRLFWTQFEIAFQRWDESMPKRAPLLRSESLWYCLFALGTLSQISADGETQDAPLLRDCWPLVTRALSLVNFRSDENVEMAMGWHVLAKRDAYVRIVLQRCCLLASEWRWTMEGVEATLARLFDIFNSHKLADLPTETEHDFPSFLRDFDVNKLSTVDVAYGEAMQDPSFHLFIRLLARAGQELRKHAVDTKDGDRRISRLFSRMTPVRVMPFTRTDVPTSSQRSVLFNHYTVVMLFLHLVPTSSPQRLRQIQSFLPAFKDADFVSQVTCIRAMMYVAVIFRHHHLDLSPVTRWFGDTISGLRREYEEIESTTKQFERQQMQQSLQHRSAQASARPDAVRMAALFENAPARQAALRRKEEVARLLVVALRSIQHVIRHCNLHGDDHGVQAGNQRLPDQLLLSAAWTQQMLEAQISLEPRVGHEVLKCIQTFLLARMRVLQSASTNVDSTSAERAGGGGAQPAAVQPQQQARDEESQDSFAELFEADDDFDFEDPLLTRLLDGHGTNAASVNAAAELQNKAIEAIVTVSTAADALERKKWDREFGDLIKTTISPSLFQLLSNIYHPDRRMEAAATGSVAMSLGVTQRLDELPMDADGAGRGSTSRGRMDRLLKAAEARQFLELVIDCWAGCAQVLVTNGLREWSSYLGFGNESWKRIDDAVGRRDVGLRFLQNVVSLDPAAVQRHEYQVEFLAVWIQTAVARVLSVQDVYTRSLMEAITKVKAPSRSLLAQLSVQWTSIIRGSSPTAATQQEMLALDLDSFTLHRLALLKATYTVLASTLANSTTSMGTAYSILSALLSALRAYVEDTPTEDGCSSSSHRKASKDYLEFCKTTLEDVETTLAGTSVMNSMRAEYGSAVTSVSARLEKLNASWEM